MHKILLILTLVLVDKACKKENITACDEPVAYTKEATTLTPGNWQYFGEKSLTIKGMQPGVYEQTNDGLKIYSEGYRSGARLSSSEKICVEGRVLYVKWKCEDGYDFNEYCISFYYDKNGYGGSDEARTDITRFTTDHAYKNSVIIKRDTWYFTRIEVNKGVARAITSANDYNTNGGTVIESAETTLKSTLGYLAIRVGDTYGGPQASVTLNHFSVAER